jgi:hypothetical protein
MLWASLGGGVAYWLTFFLGWPHTLALVIGILLTGLLGAGIVALCLPPKSHIEGSFVRFVLLILVLVLLTTVMLRALYPYYMTTTLHVLLLGTAAVGLAGQEMPPGVRVVRSVLFGLVIAGYTTVFATSARMQIDGTWPFGFMPLFDVKASPTPHRSLMLLPAYAMSQSGEFLCEAGSLTVHGAYGVHLFHDYAIEGRLRCGDIDLAVSGSDTNRFHVIGLSRAMLRSLSPEPFHRIGPVGLLKVKRVLNEPNVIVVPGAAKFPPLPPFYGTAREVTYEITLGAGEYLAISNAAFAFAADPEIYVSHDGQPLEPVASDRVTEVYQCPGCGHSDARLRVVLTTPAPQYVELVVF